MADYPAIPLFTDSYMRDCGHLSDAEHGRYFLLLMLMWQTPRCRIPNDPQWIARKLRRSVKDYEEQVLPLIKEFCSSSGNWITQKRLLREYNRLKKTTQTQSERAKSKWRKKKGVSPTPADAMPRASPKDAGSMPPYPTLPNIERDNPEAVVSTAAREPPHRIIEEKLREAAGWQNHPAPNLFVTGPIEALIAAGASLETDVLPVIRARAPSVRGSPNWKYFVGPIQDAMNARTKAYAGANGTQKAIEDRAAEARRRIQEHNAKAAAHG